MAYLSWNERVITDFSDKHVSEMYSHGYVFTRISKGLMQQTRSVRIDLSKYSPNSENRRILKKTDGLDLKEQSLPLAEYNWSIGKLAKDFYGQKFGPGIMSAQKIKEMLADPEKSNFNYLFVYSINNVTAGYSICYKNKDFFHYSYPFYDLKNTQKDIGLGMMIRAIEYAKKAGMKYIYLGSLQRPTDSYKLQFAGLEWFDGTRWSSDLEKVRDVLAASPSSGTKNKLHVIGICGVATSAIAIAFKKAGWLVTGSDKGFYPPVSVELEKNQVSFYAGWHPENIERDGRPDVIMTGGGGTSPNNPEVVYAKEHGIPVYSYPEILERYFIKKNSVVAAGTWGKTTTSALLSFILIQAGFDPSYFTGGLSLSHDTGAVTDSDWSVVEGDEYQVSISDKRPKFVYYHPSHLLLTSVSWDHADLYPTEKAYFDEFKKLIGGIPDRGVIVICADDDGATKITKGRKVITYGMAKGSAYHYHSVAPTKDGLDFVIDHADKSWHVHTPMLGRFNAQNITGVFAMVHSIGVDPDKILRSVADFKGIKRRFEKRFEGEITVFDCHAPTPEKAASVLGNIREVYNKKIIAIYEPNIGGRQRTSAGMYDKAFIDADAVIIPRLTKLKIDEGAAEKPLEGDELAAIISKTHNNVTYTENDQDLINQAKSQVATGDVIVFLGSHGFRGMIEEMTRVVR